MTDILSDERLAEIRADMAGIGFPEQYTIYPAATILSLLARLDKAEGERDDALIKAALAGPLYTARQLQPKLDAALSALAALTNARALKGVREVVAGWNGEGRADGPYPRHDAQLGATLPKTNCGAVYELDDAMTRAKSVLENGPASLADAT